MKYRIKEVLHDDWNRFEKKWEIATYYYPQYKKFLFWRNFKEYYLGVKWVRSWAPHYKYREQAENFINERRGCNI